MGPDMIIKVGPEVLYDVHIRAGGWPIKGGDIVSFKPGSCGFGCMLWIIVTLENEVLSVGVEVFQGPKIPFLKDGDVLCRVHPTINPTKSTNTMSCDVPPHHDLPTSMLYLLLGIMGIQSLAFPPPTILKPIRAKEIEL
jgi:hypothetical protein